MSFVNFLTQERKGVGGNGADPEKEPGEWGR